MADLAIGFSKKVVEGLAKKVEDAIKEEAEQWQIVERDLVFITGEFEMMQSFLDVADEERVKNNVVRTWVRQVRDLSYDVEDCIEFVIHLDTKKGWWLRLWNGVQSWNCFKEAPRRAIDQAVAEIKQLKGRVEDVSQRNLRYSLISGSGSGSASKPSAQSASSHPFVSGSAATIDLFTEARETARKHRGLVDLATLITKKDFDLQVISVWGTGGDLGVTSVIKEVYDEHAICQSFRFRAWVKLMHPFNPQEFIRSLGAQFYANSGQGHLSHGEDGEVFVRRISNRQTYLVVLEDLSSMAEWHAVRTYLPDWKNGSRIVVSTHQLEVARLCAGQPCKVSELRQFSAQHSLCIFYKETSRDEKPKGPQNGELGGMGGPSLQEKATDRMKEIVLVGRDSDADKLVSLITSSRGSGNNKPCVVTVWGVPGVGKSTLIQSVYYHCMTLENGVFKWYCWVDVSHPFSLLSFSRTMLSCITTSSESESLGGGEDHINRCQKLMRDEKCLVVIDGLQSAEDWDFIHSKLIVSGHCESCIVIVTTEESVATHCSVTCNSTVFHVEGLQVDAALQLFQKERDNNKTYGISKPIQEKVEELFSSKCGGLPSVLLPLCRYLASRPKDMWEYECTHLTSSFMHEMESNPEFVGLRDLRARMHSYFHSFAPTLKLCILYASIFPGNSVIRRRRFVRRWIAEGYSKGTDSNTMVAYAEGLFDKLAALSIISQSSSAVSGCNVNSFFREYIISRPVEEKIFFPLEVSVLEGKNCPTTERVGQHLAIGKSWERDKIVFDSLDFTRLRSLTVYGDWKPFFISDKMRVLRVLDLENASDLVTNEDINNIGKLLLRLKFLSIRGCAGVNQLPDSLGDLRQLQTLDIRSTNIDTLPPCIMKLKRLQYIHASTSKAKKSSQSGLCCLISCCSKEHQTFFGTEAGVKVASGIEKMTALHTLGVVNICAEGWEATLRDIGKLTQLRKLGVSSINKRNMKQFTTAISGLDHLESLSIWGDKFPDIMSLSNLKKLRLHMKVLTQAHIMDLSNLKRLQTLCLRVVIVEDGAKIQFLVKPIGISLEDPFSEIQVLEIACQSELEVEFSDSVMGRLELLKVDCSHESSRYTISGLEHPVSLKQVLLKGGPTTDAAHITDLQVALQGPLQRHSNPKKPDLVVKF